MCSKFSLIIDFDSTIINSETLELLGSFSLKDNNQKDNIINRVSHYTDLAMNGEITFQESLEIRLKLMKIHKKHINELIKVLNDKIDTSFLNNINFFKKHIDCTYIVSGGFKSIIQPVLLSSTNLNWNIFANQLKFNQEDYVIGVNQDNPLAFSKGKVELVKDLNLNNDIIIIGDGYTDYEIKKYGLAKHFLAYTAHAKRSNVINKANQICQDFNQVIEFIENNYNKSEN